MRIVYVDLSFCLDLLADYLLCLAAGRTCGLYLKRGRYLLAAVLGAVYSLLVQILGPGPIVSPPAKAAALRWLLLRDDAPLRRPGPGLTRAARLRVPALLCSPAAAGRQRRTA